MDALVEHRILRRLAPLASRLRCFCRDGGERRCPGARAIRAPGPSKPGSFCPLIASYPQPPKKRSWRTSADAVEMEACAVADRAKQCDVPFYAVRVVTDTFGENFPLDFNTTRTEDGRFSRAKILYAALRATRRGDSRTDEIKYREPNAPPRRWGIFLPTLDSELVAAPATYARRCLHRRQRGVRGASARRRAIGPGELLIRVESCGICHTDLKKIEYNLLAPPRIFGHETAGVVAATGAGVREFSPGDRVIVFHHIPCQRMLLLPAQALRAVPRLQEGRRHRGL